MHDRDEVLQQEINDPKYLPRELKDSHEEMRVMLVDKFSKHGNEYNLMFRLYSLPCLLNLSTNLTLISS